MSRSTSPPADATLPARADHAPEPGAAVPSHYRWCFACGLDHDAGLRMRITAGEGLRVHGEFVVTEHHQGAPGLAHGGVISTALDEILGSLNWLLAEPAVTARLEVDFTRPVPVDSLIEVEAEVLAVSGRKVYARAVARRPEGPQLAVARALFVQVPLQHFVDHAPPEYIERAVADRRDGGPGWRAVEVNP